MRVFTYCAGAKEEEERTTPFAVDFGFYVLVALGLYTLVSYFVPALNRYLSFRVLVLGFLGGAALPISIFLYRHCRAEGEDGRRIPAPSEAIVALLFTGVVAGYIVFTFIYPRFMKPASARILVLSAVVLFLLCYFALTKIVERTQVGIVLRSDPNGSESITKRFFTSLGIFLLFPVCLLLLLLVPSLRARIETTIVFCGLTAASLIGFWSVSRDVRELASILDKAGRAAEGDIDGMIETSRDGELAELADAFNIIIAERDEMIEELEEAKRRIETLVRRIGSAVSSSGSLDELMDIVLDVSTRALDVRAVYLMLESEDEGRRIMAATDEGQDGKDTRLAEEQLDRVMEEEAAVQEEGFLGVPVTGSEGVLGALGVEKGCGPIDDETEGLLHNVANQTALAVEAEQLRESEEHTYLEIITALAFTVEAKDPYTRGHSQRVSEIAVAIAREMSLDEKRIDVIRDAALLHDIGKIGVPDGTLSKAGELSSSGWEIMRDHPMMGEYIVKPVEGLQELRGPIRHHHERMDGTGYPDGLEGSEISLEARILGVADTLDAMLSDRPYRDALDFETARQEIADNRGTQFDPEVARIALQLMDEGRLPVDSEKPPQTPQEVAEYRDRRPH